MSRRVFLVLLIAGGMAACGSHPAKPTAVSAAPEGKRIEGVKLTQGVIDIAKKEGKVELVADDRVKCEKYTTTGSHRVKYRCVTLAEESESKEDNAYEMRKMQTPPPSTGARPAIGQ